MKKHLHILSYILVAVASAAAALVVYVQFFQQPSKLDQLEGLIQERFIGEVDKTAIEDAAAAAMVNALGDRWSYYIPAAEYAAYKERMANSYVGIGITISVREDNVGFDILKVTPGGPAEEAGLLAGDVLTAVEGQSAVELGTEGASAIIKGKEGTTVSITIIRDGAEQTLSVERRSIQTPVATGKLLEEGIGLVAIENFNSNCTQETIAAIESLLDQGATALIFDVRFNPGGYAHELVDVLNYLLPEGPLFRSLYYDGEETVDESDADCLEIPMAVLVNGESYSAAEFFAAALREYDAAIVVGEPTTGKGYFQTTIQLSDGSAVGLSVGKYFTPNGVSLADVGGLTPDVVLEVDLETASEIYADILDPAEDPQVQAAVNALKNS